MPRRKASGCRLTRGIVGDRTVGDRTVGVTRLTLVVRKSGLSFASGQGTFPDKHRFWRRLVPATASLVEDAMRAWGAESLQELREAPAGARPLTPKSQSELDAMLSLTAHAKYLWLAIPLLGVGELGASAYFSHRFPEVDEWRALAGEVRALKRDEDLVVIAPEWAEPLARNALTDSLMPIVDVARPDEAGYRRALEVSALGNENPLVTRWPVVAERTVGKFRLRTRTNPGFQPPRYVLTDHASPPELSVAQRGPEGDLSACRYGTRPPASMSGLLAAPALPRQRFACGPAEGNFVGTTIIEDQHDRARRCLWANPTAGGVLTLTFEAVALGQQLYGYIGFPHFRYRDHGWPKVTLSFAVDGAPLGSHDHVPESGWQPFQLSTAQYQNTIRKVQIEVAGTDSRELELCFYAATR